MARWVGYAPGMTKVPSLSKDARPYHHGDLPRALLDAAVQAIAEVGPAAVSLRDLARRAGVSHAAPAYHFGDKAYSSRANRAALRARHIPHTIPERDDQKANRARRGGRGGRLPRVDRVRYRQRNQVERGFNRRKQLRAVATRYDTQSMMAAVRVGSSV